MNQSDLTRFQAKYVLTDAGCWQWTAAIDRTERTGGYGFFWHDGRMRRAHIVSYEHHVGPIPVGLELDHLCGNRRCVCPTHLEAVSHRENVLRGLSPFADKARRTHCIHGHEFTPENTYVHPKRGSRHCRTCISIRNRGAA